MQYKKVIKCLGPKMHVTTTEPCTTVKKFSPKKKASQMMDRSGYLKHSIFLLFWPKYLSQFYPMINHDLRVQNKKSKQRFQTDNSDFS